MMKNKINLRSFDQSRFFHETALLIVLFVFFTAAFYSIAKSSLSQLSQFSVIVSAVAVYFFGRVGLRVVVFPFSVFFALLSIYLASNSLDIYYDGLSYHQDAILNLLHGDYSIFRNVVQGKYSYLTGNYPKLSWLFGAAIIDSGWKVPASKAINYLLIVAVFFFSLSVLQVTVLKRLLLALVLTLNPIAISQIYSNYVDGVLGGFLTIEILGLYQFLRVGGERRIDGIQLILIGAIGSSSLKFTGVVFSFVLIVFLLVWIFLRCRKTGFLVDQSIGSLYLDRRVLVVFGVLLIVGVVLLWNPYLNNILEGRHVFHPVLGAEKIENLISGQTRREFYELDQISKLLISVFSQSADHGPWAATILPPMKIPFAIYPGELVAFNAIDVRSAGWGPLFGGVLLLLLVVVLNSKINAEWLFIFFAVFVVSVINPESWWARFNPQLYVFAVLQVAFLMEIDRKVAAFSFSMVLFVNSFLVFYPMHSYSAGVGNRVVEELAVLAKDSKDGVLAWKMEKFHFESFFAAKGIKWVALQDAPLNGYSCKVVYGENICFVPK